MASSYDEKFSHAEQNAEIAASATEIFAQTPVGTERKNQFGSFNSLLITSQSPQNVAIRLDGLLARQVGFIVGAGQFIIKPEDGVYFDWVEVVNLSASTAITAGHLNIRHAIAKERIIVVGG